MPRTTRQLQRRLLRQGDVARGWRICAIPADVHIAGPSSAREILTSRSGAVGLMCVALADRDELLELVCEERLDRSAPTEIDPCRSIVFEDELKGQKRVAALFERHPLGHLGR